MSADTVHKPPALLPMPDHRTIALPPNVSDDGGPGLPHVSVWSTSIEAYEELRSYLLATGEGTSYDDRDDEREYHWIVYEAQGCRWTMHAPDGWRPRAERTEV